MLSIAVRAASLRSSFNNRMPERHSGDAGAIPADRTIFINTPGISMQAGFQIRPS